MKLKFYLFIFLFFVTITSCNDSTSDEFDEANPDAVARYIETINIVSAQDSEENTTITVNYDANNRVSNVTDGEESSIFVYNNNELSNISGQGDNLNIEELYESPYNAFETGEVTEYDNNGNPIMITFLEYEYDYMNNVEVEVEYTAEISYDANPNPYFYTLDAAGVIDVLDNVDLNLTMNASSTEVVQARLLFPLNNITSITYRDDSDSVIFNIDADYVYNSVNYPVSGTVTAISYGEDFNGQPENETNIYSANYTYRN
ncbi:hypothetical protein [uncultured Winogradskyella sp.]|uniref:hypothetical protein n=1 Tax=uncultured Winogradskyella sp. TaxID=395353 RepID=UPI0030D89A38|tara:strand:+ start:11545 stop:12324 length:780 start_codon:yes stop_codon:yes gene_type:complete